MTHFADSADIADARAATEADAVGRSVGSINSIESACEIDRFTAITSATRSCPIESDSGSFLPKKNCTKRSKTRFQTLELRYQKSVFAFPKGFFDTKCI